MRRVSDDERRARLAHRHFLARPASDLAELTNGLVALHSTDPATVHLSIWARMRSVTDADIAEALYVRRSLLRIHAMRRTLWVVTADLAPAMEVAVTVDVALRERKRLLDLVREHVDGDVEAWYARAAEGVIAYLGATGPAFGDELRDAVPELQLRVPYGSGSFLVGSRVLFQLAVEGHVVRTQPRGSWRSNVYSWHLRTEWAPAPESPPSSEEARATIADRWLRSFGPGTLDDIVWWTGWGKRATRSALADCGAMEVELEDGTEGYVATGDLEPIDPPESWVALLPALDSTTMGWKIRNWYLPEHADRLFDRNGNAGPTIWVDGRVVGGWAQTSDGNVATHLFEPVDAETGDRIGTRARRLADWLGDHVVVPRFRTPLEREMSSN